MKIPVFLLLFQEWQWRTSGDSPDKINFKKIKKLMHCVKKLFLIKQKLSKNISA